MSGSQCQRGRSSELRLDVTLGADFDARTGVVVILQLQIIVMAVPGLVRQTAIPITGGAAEIPRTQIADFLAVCAVPPGIQLRIRVRLGNLVAGDVNVCVGRNVAARWCKVSLV